MRVCRTFKTDARRGVLGAALMAVAAANGGPAFASSSLSEQLAKKITEARRAEFVRNYDGALAVYDVAMKMDQSTPEEMRVLLKHLAELFEQLKLFDNAEADLTQASQIAPKDATAFGDRGYFYMRRGRFNDALGDFVTGSRLDPHNPMYMYAAARARVAVEDFVGAVNFYTEAIRVGPDNARHYLARAEASVRLKRWPEALTDYDRAQALGLRSRADQYFLYAGRGYVALVGRDYPLAIARFNDALAIDPEAGNVLMWRGYAQERRGQYAAALRDYERAANFLPHEISVRDSMRRVRMAIGNMPALR